MAEASCSGTTPFKRLIDHQSSNTNHQDRLTSSSAALNASFRSSPALQHEDHAQNAFGAFVGAPSALPGLPHDPATRLAAHVSTLQPVNPQSYPRSFANAQHAFQQSQFYSHAPQLQDRTIGGGIIGGSSSGSGVGLGGLGSSWAADFSRFSAAQAQAQQSQHRATPFSTPASQFGFTPQYNSANTSVNNGFGAGAYIPQRQQQQQQQLPTGDFDQEMARWMSVHGGGNMADVDAAMDEMARELEESAAQTKSTPTKQNPERQKEAQDQTQADFANLSLEVNDAKAEQAQSSQAAAAAAAGAQDLVAAQAAALLDENAVMDHHEQEHILEELDTTMARNDEEEQREGEGEREENGGQHGQSGVAEAAEKLLDCVKHEEGEKWQNSVFLSLMRDFRDGRKDIVGDEIRTSEAARVQGEHEHEQEQEHLQG